MLRFAMIFASLIGASAEAAELRHFTGQKDGVAFDYTAELAPDQTLVLRGTYPDLDEPFRLEVSRRGHVEGQVGTAPVSFDVSPEVRDQALAGLGLQNNASFAQGAKPR